MLRPFRRVAAGITLLIGLAACGGDSGTDPTTVETTQARTVAPTTEAPTTEAAATTKRATTEAPSTTAPTTTQAPTTTTPPVPNYQGVVWRSAVDPARVNTAEPVPTFDEDGIVSRIDMTLVVPRTSPTELGRECAEEAELAQEFSGGVLADQCLYVQWGFDVAPEFRVDEYSPDGSLSAGALITPEGRQIDSVFAASGYPGTVGNSLGNMFAGGSAGSTLKFTTGSNLVGHTTHTFVVPPLEAMQPIFWECS